MMVSWRRKYGTSFHFPAPQAVGPKRLSLPEILYLFLLTTTPLPAASLFHSNILIPLSANAYPLTNYYVLHNVKPLAVQLIHILSVFPFKQMPINITRGADVFVSQHSGHIKYRATRSQHQRSKRVPQRMYFYSWQSCFL